MKTLAELDTIFNDLSDIHVNNNEEINSDFLHFGKGTNIFDIWQWMEEENPQFSIYPKRYKS